jgi:hypothetical protein
MKYFIWIWNLKLIFLPPSQQGGGRPRRLWTTVLNIKCYFDKPLLAFSQLLQLKCCALMLAHVSLLGYQSADTHRQGDAVSGEWTHRQKDESLSPHSLAMTDICRPQIMPPVSGFGVRRADGKGALTQADHRWDWPQRFVGRSPTTPHRPDRYVRLIFLEGVGIGGSGLRILMRQ